jgi:hypothetical protein
MPRQVWSEQPVPLPFIFDAYALDEVTGAEMERAPMASAAAANKARQIRMSYSLAKKFGTAPKRRRPDVKAKVVAVKPRVVFYDGRLASQGR